MPRDLYSHGNRSAAKQNTNNGAETRQALPAAGLSYPCLGPCSEVLPYPQLPLFSFAQPLPNCSAHTPVAPKCTLRHKQPDSQAEKDGQLQSSRGQPTIPGHPGYFRSPLPYTPRTPTPTKSA
ncbi:hypothetical protein A6R68_22140 [Neotoma lepida]|uniref:Uncharacterized protein n=1 Tax=Neotoma lepida TaxID=56216 RepID=A0A1A6HPJ8_NEOLE|nr:hypothetical protein A6R68_22140 [Neotoma lepida]